MAKAAKLKFESGEKMAEDEAQSGSGGKSKLIIIIVIVLVLILGGGAAYYFLSGGDDEAAAGGNEPQSKMEEEIADSSQKENIKLLDPKYTPKKNYTVNLRDGKHFLQIELVAAMEDEMALEYLAKREPFIDDMIIAYLQNLNTEDLRKRTGLDLLKRELFKKVNSVFSQEFIDDSENQDRTPVKKILITKFILN